MVAGTGRRNEFAAAVHAWGGGRSHEHRFRSGRAARTLLCSWCLFCRCCGGRVRPQSSGRSRTAAVQDVFTALFFVAMGMLFDPGILARQPLQVLAVVAVIVLGKSAAAFLIVLVFRHPLGTALTVASSLAQIWEVSFILAERGTALRLLPPESQSLIVAGPLLSITFNSFMLRAAARNQRISPCATADSCSARRHRRYRGGS